MDLFDVTRAVFRRWYVVLPLLLLVGWYSNNLYHSVKPVYYANAVLSIAPPSFRVDANLDGSPVPRNGLLDVGGPTLITNLVTLGLRDPAVVAQVVAGGGQAEYSSRIFPVPANSPELPLVMIEVSGADAAVTAKTVELVVAQASPTLRSLQQQANVPEDQMVQSFVASPPSVPIAGVPSRTRTTMAVLAAGVLGAVLCGLLVDVFIGRLKGRWQRRRVSAPTTPPPEPAVPAAPVGERRSTVSYDDDENGFDGFPPPTRTRQRVPDWVSTDSR